MIPNFNPNKWDREKILDYVIGEQPLTDEQLEFLNYFDNLQNQLEERDIKEEVFRLWLVDQFNKSQNTIYLDILMKYKEILERKDNNEKKEV